MPSHCADEMPARDTHYHSYFTYVNCENIDELLARVRCGLHWKDIALCFGQDGQDIKDAS